MSELGEVIEKLVHVIMNESWDVSDNESGVDGLNVVETYDLKPVLDALRKLDRPVQYVVELNNNDPLRSHSFDIKIVRLGIKASGFGLDSIKENCLITINSSRSGHSLPPITIDQITFVEV